MEYLVVGAGAIGGTVGAGLARDGHDVVLCDTDAEHVAAINRHGLRIEGPVEQYTVRVPAITPDELPERLGAVLLAVKAHHTEDAVRPVAARLAPDGFVVSLQNGINEPVIAAAVGEGRTVGAFVNFGADLIEPGVILRGNRAAFMIGELDGRPSDRVARLVADIADASQTGNLAGYLWSKEAYGAMLFATAVSDLSIADALAEPRYRPLHLALAREVLSQATADPEPFDGFDPADLDGSIDRLVEFNRRSAKTHSGIYRDLAVRHRKTEVDALLAAVDGPLLRLVAAIIHAIEDGRRVCERANLELLAAHERLLRLGEPLNAVIAVIDVPERAADGPLHGMSVAIKDNVDLAGIVTTNASTVSVPPPAEADATVAARLRAAGADLFCKTNLLEYAAGSVSPAYGMTFNPHDRGRTAGGSSSGSAALVGARVCDCAVGTDTGGSVRIPAAYCGIVGFVPSPGVLPHDGVFPLAPTCDRVGTLTRTVAQTAVLAGVMAGRKFTLDAGVRPRIGVLAAQIDDPDVTQPVRAAVTGAIDRMRDAGWTLEQIDAAPLRTADELLGPIILYEAWQLHRGRYESNAAGYGAGTRQLIEMGSQVTEAEYRDALRERDRVVAAVAALFAGVDVVAGPTAAYQAPPEDPPVGTPEGDVESRFTGPWNVIAMPVISLPCAMPDGELPAGLQLGAPAGADELLLSVAAAAEAAMAS
jgi:2-dehydropantoate 2-reductase